MKKLFFGLYPALLLSAVSADVVNQITFEGLDRVEKEVVEECVTIKPGKKYNENDIDATI